MSEPIFRDEALAYAARGDATGGMLRITPRWTTAGFFALVLVLALTLAGSATLKIDSRVSATAHFVNGAWRARFPVTIHPGDRIEFAGSAQRCRPRQLPPRGALEIGCDGDKISGDTTAILHATVRRSVLSTILGVTRR